jgi:putative glutamine amidotransferase
MRIALTLDRDMDWKENDYLSSLVRAGFQREDIELLHPGAALDGPFDGVVLGGGCDVEPSRYGEAPRPDARLELDPERDATDFELFAQAWPRGTPILGVCRGLQVINVALGGTLVQDIPTEQPSQVVHQHPDAEEEQKSRRDHTVVIQPGTRLSAIARVAEVAVNSRHHQAIGRPGRGLRIAAKAPDGLVEAVESETEPWLLAVQWHPENLAADPVSQRLFSEFARVVKARGKNSGISR